METDPIRQLEMRSGARVADLDMQIAASRGEESAELERTLRERQEQFVTNYLKRQTVEAAIIPGIGPAIKQRLREQGVVRAMDIDAARLGQVQGIGEGRTTALLEWRRKAEALARQTAPQSISKIEETLIRGRFYQRRFKLEQEKGKEQRKLQKEVAETRTRVAALLQAADQEIPAVQKRFDQRRDEIKMTYRERRAQIRAQSGGSDQGAAEQRTKLQQASADTQRDLTGLTAQRTSLEFRLRQYDRLEFGRYVRRVILPTSP